MSEHPFTPRGYQARAVQSLRTTLAEGWKRQMLYSPTGSGKTEIALMLIRGAINKGKRVVFLCNRIGLVEQASRRFLLSGIQHGVIQGQNTCRLHEQVLVASIKTVARRGMPDCDLIIIDEAHGVAGSRDFRAVIFQRSAVPVIGLSATPFARGLGRYCPEIKGELFQCMTVAATIPELIDDGYLVDCDIYAPSEPDMTGIKTTKNAFGEIDFSDADVGRAVDKPQLIGDIVSHWLKLAAGTPTVCFAANIAHSKHITESFRAAGVAAEHIDCYTDEHERIAILNRVSSGETQVISNVGILTEGWDFPACKTMILARPTRSLTRYIQMAGRVLRPHELKDRALILDHSGTSLRLGFPTDELKLELDDGKPKKAGQDEQQKPEPKPCAVCAYVKPPRTPVCPKCGNVAQVKHGLVEEDGELELVNRKKKARFEDKQQCYSELLAIKLSKGYSDGWVAHKYRAMFGVWPRGMQDVCAEPSAEVRSFVQSQNIRFAKATEKRNAA